MGAEINYELLVGLNPDLVLLYGIGDAQTTVTDKLKELNIPYMYVGEYLEESPLGQGRMAGCHFRTDGQPGNGIQKYSRADPRTL